MFEIAFNQHTSFYAVPNNKEHNLMYVRCQEDYVNDLLKHRGYVYMNEIYTLFGIMWDPKRENPCCIYDGNNYIKFGIQDVDDGFIITIDWNK